MDYIFAFDVSSESVISEFLHSSCEALKKVLFGIPTRNGVQSAPVFPDGCRVAILTFDTTLHFYDISVCHKSGCFECDSDFVSVRLDTDARRSRP
jgi:protein transport protein SEC24